MPEPELEKLEDVLSNAVAFAAWKKRLDEAKTREEVQEVRLKSWRGAGAKRGMWKSRKGSSGWQKGSADLSDTYRLVMSRDPRDVEKILPREDAIYFRSLPRSQREKLLRKVEKKIERMTDIPDWRPGVGTTTSSFPVQRPDGQRRTKLFLDSVPEHGSMLTRDQEAGSGIFLEGESLLPEQREVIYEGASLNTDQRHGFFEGAQLDLGQAEGFLSFLIRFCRRIRSPS